MGAREDAVRRERKASNMEKYGTNVPTQEMRENYDAALMDVGKKVAASAAGFSSPTISVANDPNRLKQRTDLFERMKTVGTTEASKLREDARVLGVTSAGFDLAMSKIPYAPAAPTSPAPPASPATPSASVITPAPAAPTATSATSPASAVPLTPKVKTAATDAEYAAARDAEYAAAPVFKTSDKQLTNADRVLKIIDKGNMDDVKSKYNFDPSATPPAAIPGSTAPKPVDENYERFIGEINKARRERGETAMPGTSDAAKERARDKDPLGLGGTEADRTRAQVTKDVMDRSATSTKTRRDILEEINDERRADGKAPVTIDFKDVAAVDKEKAKRGREAARNKAEAGIPVPDKTKSADAILKEELDRQKKVRESKSPKLTEPTLPDLLAISDAAVKKEDDARKKREEKNTPQKSQDRTISGDLKYLRDGSVENIDKVLTGVSKGVIKAQEVVSRKYDELLTDSANYLIRKPGESKVLTNAARDAIDAKLAAELRKARGGR